MKSLKTVFVLPLALWLGVASLANADKASRPNILFVILDDASYPHMGAYGTEWVRTPGFDRIAGEGILFNNAYTPNAKCAPSRATVLTGRNSWQLGQIGVQTATRPAGLVKAGVRESWKRARTAKLRESNSISTA